MKASAKLAGAAIALVSIAVVTAVVGAMTKDPRLLAAGIGFALLSAACMAEATIYNRKGE